MTLRGTPGSVRGSALVASVLVVVAGVAGWTLAGPPDDATALVPPSCPALLDADGVSAVDGAAGGDTRATDVLVPMPLPQPRGPVSVRLCGYRSVGDEDARYTLDRQVVLDPTRTAELAGRLNSSPGEVVTASARSSCPPGGHPAMLVFRYTEGAPSLVAVPGGPCSLVASSARAERGRADVVRQVAELFGTVG